MMGHGNLCYIQIKSGDPQNYKYGEISDKI